MHVGLTIVLLALGLACAPLSAVCLAHGSWQIWHPRRALALWLALGAFGLAAATGAVLLAASQSIIRSPGESIVHALVLTLLAWMGLGALGIAASFAISGGADDAEEGEADQVADRRGHAARALLSHRTDSWYDGAVLVVEVDDAALVACAVGGAEPTVFVARRVRRALRPLHLEAIVAHERAHLSGRHGAVRRLGAWHAACLPKRSALRRCLVTRVRLLTELAADDGAAARVGAPHLRAALVAVHTLAPSSELVVRARRLDAIASRGGEVAPAGVTRSLDTL